MNAIVTKACYLNAYSLEITFKDSHVAVVDFGPFLHSDIPLYIKAYLEVSKFKNFKIENGNVVWGEDWDLVFPREQLYNGKIDIWRKAKAEA